MSTNYYLHRDFCKCCGKPKDILHIGQSSAGWRFLFNYQDGLKKYEDLNSFLDTGIIYDEYDNRISKKEFLQKIEDKQKSAPRLADNYMFLKVIDGYEFMEW